MKRSLLASLVMVLVAALGVGLSAAPSASAPERGRDRLEVYTATVDPEQLTLLAEQGFDLTEARASGSLTEVSLVMDRVQAARLRAQGIGLKLTRVKGGQTVRQFAAAQAGRRVQRLALVRRARRHPRPDVRRGAAEPESGQGEAAGHHGSGPRDPGGQAGPKAAADTTRAAGTTGSGPSSRRCSTAPPSTRASGSPPRSTAG